LAEMKLSRQDWQGAEEIATRLKSMGDTSGLGERLQGAVLFGQQKFDESIEMLKSASGSSPGAPRAVQALVLAYVKAGKIDEAEKFTQSVLDANPNNVEAIVIMGSLKTMKNQPAEAEVLFKKAIDVGPTTAAGYAALARLYATQSMQAEAEAVLRSGHEKLPGDAGLGLGLAGMLESRQDIEGAIAIYEKQLAATPNALVIANNLASLLADYRSDADSLERAQTVARVLEAVDVPQFQDTLGWIAYRRGEYRNAASRLEQAAAKLPKNALVRYHLGMTYAALKRPEDARKEFAEATANASNDKALLDKIAAAQAELK